MIEFRPKNAGAFINRGNAYFQQGFYGKAAYDYMTAVGHWFWPW